MSDDDFQEFEEVIFSKKGSVGHILLNRPKALNALTLEMVMAMTNRLHRWSDDEDIVAVVVEGAGEKGFCAGGDIRALYDSGKAQTDYWYKFYSNEYRLDTLIHEYPKPYISLLNGITMGGGVGISINGKFRIASERTVFAMPETGIGLIPDVGGSYFLPRLPGAAGMYLGLTGARLRGPDATKLGVATHFMPEAETVSFMDELCGLDPDDATTADVESVIAKHTEPEYVSPYDNIRENVDAMFSGGSVQTICSSLEAAASEWSLDALRTLRSKSPLSVMVTFEQLRRGKNLTFRDGIAQELRCVMHINRGHDFYEGVRAVIVDKDNEPKWSPAQLEDVLPEKVAAHFENIGKQELVFL